MRETLKYETNDVAAQNSSELYQNNFTWLLHLICNATLVINKYFEQLYGYKNRRVWIPNVRCSTCEALSQKTKNKKTCKAGISWEAGKTDFFTKLDYFRTQPKYVIST
jgi:hypothetical protein